MPSDGKKFLGIDFGDRYIGLALAEQNAPALPIKTVEYNENFWSYIDALTRDEKITDIVVGMPTSMTGRENKRTDETKKFIEQLKHRIALPVHAADERLSTKAAEAHTRHVGRVDAFAASEILQSYLERDART